MARRTKIIISATVLSIGLAGCVTVTDEAPLPPRVWPEAPETARIAHVRSITRPEDLGITRGFWRRLADWIAGASEEERLIRPMAVLAAPDGVIYVADPGAHGVHRFDTRRGEHRVLRLAGDEPMLSPVALARAPDGTLYIADSARAAVYAVRPGEAGAVRLTVEGDLLQPTGLVYDAPRRRLITVDTAAHRLKIFSTEGARLAVVGRRGDGDGEFNFPTLAWIDRDGQLWVTDSLNFRVQRFDADGRYLSAFGKHGDATGDLSRPKGIATDRAGNVYVVDGLFHAFQVFEPGGRFLLAVGAQGRDRGEFWLPSGIFIDPDDVIYIADSHNQRVQVFRYLGGAS